MKNAKKLLPCLLMVPVVALVLLLLTSPAFGDLPTPHLPHVLTSTDYSLCLTGAVLLAVCLMALLQWRRPHPVNAAVFAGLATPLSIILGRLCYCVGRYRLFLNADNWPLIFDLTQGGYLLYGALLGTILAAWLYGCVARRPMAKVLDAVAVPGLLLIGLGRLAEYFTSAGRGDYVDSGLLSRFPFSVQDEWGYSYLAPFLWEGVAALVLMVVVWLLCHGGKGSFELALVLYACCQAVLESVPNDVCIFGFVRVNQVASGLIVLGFTAWRAFNHFPLKMAWLRTGLCVMLIAVIGVMEWGLDKLQTSNVILYGVMVLASAGMAVNLLTIPPVRDA